MTETNICGAARAFSRTSASGGNGDTSSKYVTS